MKKLVVLMAVAFLCISTSVMASVPIVHPTTEVLQAYPGDSNHTDRFSYGLKLGRARQDTITSVPGNLGIVPGTTDWMNFVSAAKAKKAYVIKSVVMQKTTPQTIQCADVFPAKTIVQQGTTHIRLWWPLMYEVPDTTWTLTILYGTLTAWDDDGPGPNPPSFVHTDVWTWHVDATISSMKDLLELFHELPFGTSEVPLISDEDLYPALQAKLDVIQQAINSSDLVTAGNTLGDFDMEVMDACIATTPSDTYPTGLNHGIAQTSENPACCKLLVDAEYVGFKYNLFDNR